MRESERGEDRLEHDECTVEVDKVREPVLVNLETFARVVHSDPDRLGKLERRGPLNVEHRLEWDRDLCAAPALA